MGVDLSIHYGAIAIVELPPNIREYTRRECSNESCITHHNLSRRVDNSGMFCSQCGSRIIDALKTQSYLPSIHTYCEEVFGDCDMFCDIRGNCEGVSGVPEGSIAIHSNRSRELGSVDDTASAGIIEIESIMKFNHNAPEWVHLFNSFDERGIKYTKKIALFHYWS